MKNLILAIVMSSVSILGADIGKIEELVNLSLNKIEIKEKDFKDTDKALKDEFEINKLENKYLTAEEDYKIAVENLSKISKSDNFSFMTAKKIVDNTRFKKNSAYLKYGKKALPYFLEILKDNQKEKEKLLENDEYFQCLNQSLTSDTTCDSLIEFKKNQEDVVNNIKIIAKSIRNIKLGKVRKGAIINPSDPIVSRRRNKLITKPKRLYDSKVFK